MVFVGFDSRLTTLIKYKDMQEVIKYWSETAKGERCNELISPTELTGQYKKSGEIAAAEIVDLIFMYSNIEPKESKIIDYGCGNGRVAIPMTDYFKKVYAVDCVAEMLQQIPKSKKIDRIKSDVNNNFETPDKADAAYTISVFNHCLYEDCKEAFKSIADNLKPGAVFLCHVPIYDKPRQPNSPIDVGVWTESMLQNYCDYAGFEILELNKCEGSFSYENIQIGHSKFQILLKK